MFDTIKSIINNIGEKFNALWLIISEYLNQYIIVTMMVLYSYILDPSGKQDVGKTINNVVYLCGIFVLISIIIISIPYYIYKMETSGKDTSISGKYKDYLDTYITTLTWVGVFLMIMLLSYFVLVMEYVSGKSIIRLIGISGLCLTGASFISIFQALPFINIKRCMII
jgi:magnesium-transporting ATPase (P-type)